MNAKEAAKLAKLNAVRYSKEKVLQEQKEAKAASKKRKDKHQKWFDETLKEIRTRIEYRVRNGERKLEHTIDPEIHYNFVSDADKLCSYGDRKNFDFLAEAKKIVITLQLEDYKASVEVVGRSEDGTASYMNSGGECGFEGVRYYQNLAIIVEW